MAKKIYDIYPPNIKKEEKTMSSSRSPKKKKKFPTFFSFKNIILFIVSFFLIFIIFSHTVFLNAEIIIWPETNKEFYSGEVTVDSSIFSSNLEEGIIPAEIFEIKEEETRVFSSSGKETEGRKAEGMLKVYNNYSVSTQSLIEGTRFISSDGKLFHSTERISIPGRREEGGRIVPGETEVLVRAAEPGEEYNIERTSKFSVPGLQGTALYTEIYAENPEPITKGYIGELPLITEEDIENAKNLLISDLFEKAKGKVKKEAAGGFIVENELIEESVLNESFYPGIGENSDSFEYSINISLKIISFKKSDIEEKIKNELFNDNFLLEEKIGMFSGKEIFRDELEINISPELINFREGKATLKIDSKVPVYSKIDEENFKKNLSGKNFEEVKIIMDKYSEISEFELNYWPFWINNMPRFDKINIKIKMKK